MHREIKYKMLSCYDKLADFDDYTFEKQIMMDSFSLGFQHWNILNELMCYVNSTQFDEEKCRKNFSKCSLKTILKSSNFQNGESLTKITKDHNLSDSALLLIDLLEVRALHLSLMNKMFADIYVKLDYINFMYHRLVELRMNHLGSSVLDPAIVEIECFKYLGAIFIKNPSFLTNSIIREHRTQRLKLGIIHDSYQTMTTSKYQRIIHSIIYEENDNSIINNMMCLYCEISEKAIIENRISEYEGILHILALKTSSLLRFPWLFLHPRRGYFPGDNIFQGTMELLYKKTFVEDTLDFPRLLFA